MKKNTVGKKDAGGSGKATKAGGGLPSEPRESAYLLHSIVQGFSIPAFVIGKDHRILYWNRALEQLSKIPMSEVVGTNQQWRAFYAEPRPCMADLLVDGVADRIPKWYEGKYHKSDLLEEAFEATDFFPALGDKGVWLRFTAATIRDRLVDNGLAVSSGVLYGLLVVGGAALAAMGPTVGPATGVGSAPFFGPMLVLEVAAYCVLLPAGIVSSRRARSAVEATAAVELVPYGGTTALGDGGVFGVAGNF